MLWSRDQPQFVTRSRSVSQFREDHPRSVLIQLPLAIPEVKVLATACRPDGALRIKVESTCQGARCGRCGRAMHPFHGYDRPIQLRHLPILEQRVYLESRPTRYRCPHGEGGPTTTPPCEWDDPNCPHPKGVEKGVLRGLVNSTVVDVRQKLGLGPDAVEGILDRWVSTTVDWRAFTPLETLGIEEIALTRGHGNDVAVISTRDAHGQLFILAGLPNRLKATVKGFLEAIPAALKATIQTACTAMDEGYVNAVEEVLRGVTLGVDRFQVAQCYRDSGDHLRKQELKRLQQQLPAAEYEPLKGLFWVVRQAWTALSEAEQERLLPLFRHSPALEQAYCLRQVLTGICNSSFTNARATEAIEGWCEQVRASGLRCFDGLLTPMANWRAAITNDFLERRNSGFVEGRNNKVQVLKRRCSGLDSIKPLFQRLQLDLEGYRLFGMG